MCFPVVVFSVDSWEDTYALEIGNFQDHGDVGEVWFGEDSSLRVTRWLSSCDEVLKDDAIIDLGCGNGMQLIELSREGFTNLTGVDYSETAIILAKAVADAQQNATVKYEVCDILAEDSENIYPLMPSCYAVVLDKGTYDAISLHPENAKEKRVKYVERVGRLLKQQGLLIITSCNWTEVEIISHFCSKFERFHIIPTPTFQFGGKTGSLITSIVLRKKF
uniref:Protein-lysine N-methyltransferase TPSB3V08_LOCUS6394 n=1 Tax=Timema poppense TaxID=170557 RepID=A0A7R9H4E2_TIMPO|nr:unnamed protein product [Timema poppensis]